MTQDEVKELMNKGLITQVINPVDIVNNMETPPTGGCECTDYVLPIATKDTLGGVKVGTGLDILASNHTPIGISKTGEIGVNIGGGLYKNISGELEVRVGTGLNITNRTLEVKIGSGLDIESNGPLKVKIGSGLGFDSDGVLIATGGSGSDYQLPIAGTEVLGGVIIGTGGLNIDAAGELSVKFGNGLGIDSNGSLFVTGGGSGSDYELPIASEYTLGGVKVGTNLSEDGKFSPIGINSATGEIGLNYGDGLDMENSKLSITMANSSRLGGVKVGTQIGSSCPYAKIGINNTTGEIGLNYGDGLSIDSNGKLYVTSSGGSNYKLPIASNTTLGGVKVGGGLKIDKDNGHLGVKIGTGLDIDFDGHLNLRQASGEYLGGVIIGDGLSTGELVKDGYYKTNVNIGPGLKINDDNKIELDIDYIYEQFVAKGYLKVE